MPYEIGKVFSDSVTNAFTQAKAQAASQPSTFTRGPRNRLDRNETNLEAARIRSATADADRASKERLAGASEARKADTSQTALGIRQQNADEVARHNQRTERLRGVTQAFDMDLKTVRTAQQGADLLRRLYRTAYEKDAYGRSDPELIQLVGGIIDHAKQQMTLPVDKGGFGLPGSRGRGDTDGIEDAYREIMRELATGMQGGGVGGAAPAGGGRVQSGGAPATGGGARTIKDVRESIFGPTPERGAPTEPDYSQYERDLPAIPH